MPIISCYFLAQYKTKGQKKKKKKKKKRVFNNPKHIKLL